jgi:uncharacterized protein (TIGR02118 family)
MEKLVFIFRHKEGISREDFHRHYVEEHSPLGLRLQPGLEGYTVNHLVSEAEFDTVTEIWTPSLPMFAGGETGPSPEIVADHISFMGPQDSYLVEERVIRDGPVDAALGRPGIWCKVVSFHATDEGLPAIPEAAVRVVDNIVREQIYARDRRLESGTVPALAVIRTSWYEDSEKTPELAQGVVVVREYRYRATEDAQLPG